jgi:hypothetical protein
VDTVVNALEAVVGVGVAGVGSSGRSADLCEIGVVDEQTVDTVTEGDAVAVHDGAEGIVVVAPCLSRVVPVWAAEGGGPAVELAIEVSDRSLWYGWLYVLGLLQERC